MVDKQQKKKKLNNSEETKTKLKKKTEGESTTVKNPTIPTDTTLEDKTEGESTTVTSSQLEEIIKQLNSGYSDSKGKKYTVIQKNKDGTYKVNKEFEEYVALNVINNTDLTQSQKDDLLYNKFKVSENKIRNVLSENQYRPAQDDWNWPQ